MSASPSPPPPRLGMEVRFSSSCAVPTAAPPAPPGGPAAAAEPEAPRGLVFPKGSDLGLMFASMMDNGIEAEASRREGASHIGAALEELLAERPGGSRAYMMPVSSRPAVVKDVASQTLYVPYAEQRMSVIATAEKHQVHPDAIRKVAHELHGRWVRGDPHTMVVSHVISDLNQPAHASDNSREVTQFDHRQHPPFVAGRHRDSLPIDEDFLVADPSVYIYAGVGVGAGKSKAKKKKNNKSEKDETVAPSSSYPSRRCLPANAQQAYDRREELYIYNATSKMSDVCVRAFEQALLRPSHLDVDFIRHFEEVMHTHRRWLPKVAATIVQHLCSYIMQHTEARIAPPPIKLHLVREGKAITVAFDQLKSMAPSAIMAYVDQTHAQVEQQMRQHHPPCVACAIGARMLRCQHCGELRYCTEECREHDFQADHKFACKVYLKKTRNVTVPPGGPVVMQAKPAKQA